LAEPEGIELFKKLVGTGPRRRIRSVVGMMRSNISPIVKKRLPTLLFFSPITHV
jgi:hypothetical protein